MAVTRMHIDPDIGIPDLIHRLSDDSKRLMKDEIRLGKLELADDAKRAGHAGMWLAMAFGVAVVAMVSLTIMLVTLIGRLAAGHMWVGAIATGAVEVVVALVLIKRGKAVFAEPSYSLEQTRKGMVEAVKG
jgi:uncharacterized membrane protein YqjE